ncbi:MAG TPA: NAD-dependent epimerase/dehydratase family protein [Candidatus Dormibacteraeota bacterium]|nr:NAD-dependent epimerase/dehydratase family protein [Candidatus Dormibacteraeota bacterium]
MRVAVLGGTRFIGRAAVEELAAAGHELLLVHRGALEPDGLPAARHLHTDRAELHANREHIAEFRPDAALDCRALTRADAETGLAALPDGIRLVVISSMDVYRAFGAVNLGAETDPVPIDEDSPLRSERYPYRDLAPDRRDYDKLDVEDVYLPAGATSLRLPMVYGEHDYQRREEYILRRVRARRARIPFGSGQWLTCRGYVRDLARGIRLALEKDVARGAALNLGDDRTYSVRMWSRMILDAAGSDAELVRVSDGVLPPDLEETGTLSQHVIASSRRAQQLLGWTPSNPEDSLRTSVAWHLAHPPENPDPDFSADDRALAEAGSATV